jgi:hypothetical protein
LFLSKRDLRLRELTGGLRLAMIGAKRALQVVDRGSKRRTCFLAFMLRLKRAPEHKISPADFRRKRSRLRFIQQYLRRPPGVCFRLVLVTEKLPDFGSAEQIRLQETGTCAALFERPSDMVRPSMRSLSSGRPHESTARPQLLNRIRARSV